jgi:hypothetical protein
MLYSEKFTAPTTTCVNIAKSISRETIIIIRIPDLAFTADFSKFFISFKYVVNFFTAT